MAHEAAGGNSAETTGVIGNGPSAIGEAASGGVAGGESAGASGSAAGGDGPSKTGLQASGGVAGGADVGAEGISPALNGLAGLDRSELNDAINELDQTEAEAVAEECSGVSANVGQYPSSVVFVCGMVADEISAESE